MLEAMEAINLGLILHRTPVAFGLLRAASHQSPKRVSHWGAPTAPLSHPTRGPAGVAPLEHLGRAGRPEEQGRRLHADLREPRLGAARR